MDDAAIPSHFWSVRPAPPDEDGDEQVLLRGTVLVRVNGLQPADAPGDAAPLSRELLAAQHEPPLRAGRELLRLLRTDGVLTPLLLLGAALVASAGVVIEGLLFRGLLDLSNGLARAEQRGAAMIALIIFATILLLFEFPIATSTLRFGRKVETGLRLAFLRKIPLLSDRYFQSRPVSDMAERSHSVQRLCLLMDIGRQITLAAFELVLTAFALAWLYPAGAPIMLGAALLVLGIPLLAQPALWERDLRVRTHLGALGRFYLDALLGLVAIRTHHAERAVRREHEALTTEWARAGFERRRATIAVEGLLAYVGYGAAAWLLFSYLASVQKIGVALLLTYWAIKLPLLGERIAQLSLQYPTLRTTLLRLLEPLGAPEQHSNPLEAHGTHAATRDTAAPLATRIDIQQVRVQATGHTILHDLDLAIAPGSHVAIIGPSGAGKSSLVGLLLGWHRPASGCLLVDGQPLDEARLEQLRSTTAWVDPAVQIWNRALLDNLHYGTPDGAAELTGSILEQADLYDVLQRLPDGLQTRLGEGGGLVSGGEGQRVRFGRALLRADAGLVILDEPFRGLDRAQRRGLLERARQLWPDATLLCITHDVRETLTFERVLVVEAGQIVEDGPPDELAARPDSRYQAMLDAEQAVHDEFWSSETWRRLRIENGQLTELTQQQYQASEDSLLQSEASHEQL